MATVPRIVDDFNPELDAETRTFELLGQKYEIDIAFENMAYFENMVEAADRLIKTARPVSSNGKKSSTSVDNPKNAKRGISSNRGSRSGGKSKSSRAKKAVDGASPAAVRKWAQDNNVEVSATGVIQKSTYDAYNEAHKPKE